ncbi:hypothetical protein [Paenisporosarcina cavernae]|uniref:Uncharacterized protein n=1 Tax=Paenisporosarcina cavernae TaxID=2320858 RepID=A0A385YQI0_9BACL|nr:hypothetical protein [Paenisporosarcina cavernae]AYC28731.1 hypothetical protein D3873_02155 [Paenisporosarcina cavernae]
MNETLTSRDYSYEIQSLKDLITVIQSNLNFTLSIFLGVISVAITIAGVALFHLAKTWVHKRVDTEIKTIDDKIKGFLAVNPPILWARGSGVLISSQALGEVSTAYKHEYQVIGLKDFSKEDIIYIDAYYIHGGKKTAIEDSNVSLMENGVKVNVVETIGTLRPNFQVHVFLLWSNPRLKK